MKIIQCEKGWLDKVEPGVPFRMKRGMTVTDQFSRVRVQQEGQFYTVKQVAEKFQVREQTIGDWIRAKKLECHRVGQGRAIRISDAQLAKFLNLKEAG